MNSDNTDVSFNHGLNITLNTSTGPKKTQASDGIFLPPSLGPKLIPMDTSGDVENHNSHRNHLEFLRNSRNTKHEDMEQFRTLMVQFLKDADSWFDLVNRVDRSEAEEALVALVVKTVSHHTVEGDPKSKETIAKKIDLHKAWMEKEYTSKAEIWSTSHTKHQQCLEAYTRAEAKKDLQKNKIGQSAISTSGQMSFLTGFSDESHHREQKIIIQELQRYVVTELLRLRQSRVEELLKEFCDSGTYLITTGKHSPDSVEYRGLMANMWNVNSVRESLTSRRFGPSQTKAELARRVSNLALNRDQKAHLLDTLNSYLQGIPALREVLNSPCCDRRGGKSLSRCGTKVFDADKHRAEKRNRQNLKRKNPNSPSGGKGPANKKKNEKGRFFCKHHDARVTHKPAECFLNRKSTQFRGEKYLKDYETKNKREVLQD